MHLFNFILALMATFSMVMAAPVEQDSAIQGYASPDDGEIVAREVDIEEPETESFSTLGCPNGWRYCGCTKQSGGGDGKLCGSNYLIEDKFKSPWIIGGGIVYTMMLVFVIIQVTLRLTFCLGRRQVYSQLRRRPNACSSNGWPSPSGVRSVVGAVRGCQKAEFAWLMAIASKLPSAIDSGQYDRTSRIVTVVRSQARVTRTRLDIRGHRSDELGVVDKVTLSWIAADSMSQAVVSRWFCHWGEVGVVGDVQ
ncbi:uncharacterized protein KD926_003164 [Aspergillus affinis]|uniref:uncharacterized protein n=1 Tax=Aspergillus affinis TaxID=1070780 RepID=UPI0022FECE13|nr:uncharacterized protein KD926_003164 [Aspergillus affinis]KAI9035653.1 hypothetical protein KD926_003164 [Aspergillus affinis]